MGRRGTLVEVFSEGSWNPRLILMHEVKLLFAIISGLTQLRPNKGDVE